MIGNSASMIMEQYHVSTLAVKVAANMLFNRLQASCFSECKLAQLPRVFRRSTVSRYSSTDWRNMAKAEFEVADSGCKISESELDYWLLEHSGLVNDEKERALGQAGEAYY